MPTAFDVTFVPPDGSPMRRRLSDGEEYVVGRGADCDLRIDGDPSVSREHCRVRVHGGGVDFERLPEATNPLFHEGEEVATCRIEESGVVVVGGTVVHVAAHENGTPDVDVPVEEIAFDPAFLQRVRYTNPGDRVQVLSHLPDLIRGARTEAEFRHRLTSLLLAGVPHAEAVAVVEVAEDGTTETLHWERRRETDGDVRVSRRLVRESLTERRRSYLRVWEAGEGPRGDDFTSVPEFDWAFCTPVFEHGRPWGLYVAGRMESVVAASALDRTTEPRGRSQQSTLLHADVKFTELVAETVRAVKQLRTLEQRQTSLRQFFAPAVLRMLGDDPGLLEPRECDVTVMFCDLRGFSREAEASREDLMELLSRVGGALEVMNDAIQAHGGVTADFLGDAALGFWGWPLDQPDAPRLACRAALAIREAFARARDTPGHPLERFQTGIGVASGRAVAGKIGTSEHVKVTVFGPVVNLSSRLEGMTKQLHVPIAVDDATAVTARTSLGPEEGRLRRLGRVRPFGFDGAVDVHEVLPPYVGDGDLTDEQLTDYDRSVESFVEGRWEEALELLARLPASDRAQDFLVARIVGANRIPPADWDGVVALPQK